MSDLKSALPPRDLSRDRASNVRQLLANAHRKINALVAEELAARGYDDVRLIHSRLLENLDRGGNSITLVAKRAQMTKQAMGALAGELEAKGYLTRRVDENDGRITVLHFTTKGWRLMLQTFEIVADIERDMSATMGPTVFAALQAGLGIASEPSTFRGRKRRKPSRS